jgi:hypothetical protein
VSKKDFVSTNVRRTDTGLHTHVNGTIVEVITALDTCTIASRLDEFDIMVISAIVTSVD